MIALEPDHDDALLFLGLAHTSLGRHANAEDAYRRAIALRPTNPPANNYLGLVYQENLEMGAYGRSDRREIREDMEMVLDKFPVLRERRKQFGATLSVGERQMLAIGRALVARPKLLMLDEPSLGLAPLLVREIFRIIMELKREKRTILLVEQNARKALLCADRGYVIETGTIVLSGSGEALLKSDEVQAAYLGGTPTPAATA